MTYDEYKVTCSMRRESNEKKVLLLCGVEIEKAPYVLPYIELLKQNSVSFDLLCQKSQMAVDVAGENVIGFGNKFDSNAPEWKKLLMMLEQAKIVKRVIRKNGYSKIIVFTAQKGIFLSRFLKKNFHGQYVLDIRDHTSMLRIPLCNRLLKSVIENSAYTVISSAGFKRWLPESDKYIVCHNTSFDMIEYGLNNHALDMIGVKILIIGQIAYLESQIALIDGLRNSNDFTLSFVGQGPASMPLQDYVEVNKLRNVTFAGRYQKKEERRIVQDYDFISIFLLHSLNADTCMANRFYLSAVMRKPMIVAKNSWQAEVAAEYGIGVIVEDAKSLPDELDAFKQNYNGKKYETGCREFLMTVKGDMNLWKSSILKFTEHRE